MIIRSSLCIIVETLNLRAIQTNFVQCIIIKMFGLMFISKTSQAIVNPLSTKYSENMMNFL